MQTINGYIWSKKYQCWRKLPRAVWLKIQRNKSFKIQSNKDGQGKA